MRVSPGSGFGGAPLWGGVPELCQCAALVPAADCPPEDSGEEKSPPCELAFEDILPAVKTLIRAVR